MVSKKFTIKLGKPSKFEILLIVILIFLLFWSDILANKAVDLGENYIVHFFKDLSGKSLGFTAITGYWWVMVFYHITLITIFIRSLFKRKTTIIPDAIVGTIQIFGTILLIVGAISSLYTQTIPFFGFTTNWLNIYHAGILIQIVGSIYWATTE